MQDVAQMTHHRAEGRHGLRGAEDASAALAELCRTGERGASAKVGATQQYGFTGSRLPRLRGSRAVRFDSCLWRRASSAGRAAALLGAV